MPSSFISCIKCADAIFFAPAVLCLTIYSDLLSRVGRKPMFAFTSFCLTTSILLFGLGGRPLLRHQRLQRQPVLMTLSFLYQLAHFKGNLGIVLIALNFFFSGIGSQPLLQLTFQSYIVDCVDTDERSPTFALLGSATFGGLAISALSSAAMTSRTKYVGMKIATFQRRAAIPV